MLKLAVVVTTYNHEKYIAQALDSILRQKTNFKFELVVSDDCSTDGTASILRDYEGRFPELVKPIYNKKNLGAMNNYIHALSSIKAEYVAICDGDDYWTDDYKIQKQVDFLDSNSDFSVCFHQTKIFFDDGSRLDEISPLNVRDVTTLDDLLIDNYIPANSVVYRWGFNYTNFADTFPLNIVPGDHYTHLLHAKNGKIKFIEQVMSNYRRHEGGFWWVTADSKNEDKFILKFGLKYLNFLSSVEQNIKNDCVFYQEKKKYLVNKLIVMYLRNNMLEELKDLSILHNELYFNFINQFISSTQSFENSFLPTNLSKWQKAACLLIIDRPSFKKKIIHKLKCFYKIFLGKLL